MERPRREERRKRASGQTRQDPELLARRIARLALAKRAEDVRLLDLRQLSSVCDFFLVATGLSEPHVKAVAEHIEESLAADAIRPWHIEGRRHRKWVLLDYVDVVVHLFLKETREFYRLEHLWAEAPQEELTVEGETMEANGPEARSEG